MEIVTEKFAELLEKNNFPKTYTNGYLHIYSDDRKHQNDTSNYKSLYFPTIGNILDALQYDDVVLTNDGPFEYYTAGKYNWYDQEWVYCFDNKNPANALAQVWLYIYGDDKKDE